jgi:uncharacterized protein (DUF305 family)
MTSSHARAFIAGLLVTMTVAGCSGARRSASPGQAPPSPQRPVATAQIGGARYPYTAADVQFMSMMIGHHAQALVMSRWAATHGASTSVRALAERILNGQQDEITVMQQWLRDRGQPVPEVRPTGKIVINGIEHEHLMPGMLSDDQMQQLEQARGTDFDRLFLTFMIQHHRGAVSMVQDLFRTHGAGLDDSVFRLASDVNAEQTSEIDRMQQMLVAILFEPSAP